MCCRQRRSALVHSWSRAEASAHRWRRWSARGLSDSGHGRCRHKRCRRRSRRLGRRLHRGGPLRRRRQGCGCACSFGLRIERTWRWGHRWCSRGDCGSCRRRRIARPFDHQGRHAAQRLHLRLQRCYWRCQFEHHAECASHRLTGAHRGHQSGSARQFETTHARGFGKIDNQACRVRQRQRFEAATAGQLNFRAGTGGPGTDANALDFAGPGSKTARLKLAVRAERQNWRIPGVMALDSSTQLCELQGNFP